MRPEAELDLRGHMTTQSKWYQINYRGCPKSLNAYPRPKFKKHDHSVKMVKFGLWPHVGGLIEYLSNSSQTIRKYAIPVNF